MMRLAIVIVITVFASLAIATAQKSSRAAATGAGVMPWVHTDTLTAFVANSTDDQRGLRYEIVVVSQGEDPPACFLHVYDPSVNPTTYRTVHFEKSPFSCLYAAPNR